MNKQKTLVLGQFDSLQNCNQLKEGTWEIKKKIYIGSNYTMYYYLPLLIAISFNFEFLRILDSGNLAQGTQNFQRDVMNYVHQYIP